MSHLTMEQQLQLREPGREPGTAAASAHLESCLSCRAESDRMFQRVARLKALPTLAPARDAWPMVRARLEVERRRRRNRWMELGGLAVAAGIALVLILHDMSTPAPMAASTEISAAMSRSQQLEDVLESYNADGRVTDGQTARMAGDLEDRIARVDRELELAQMLNDHQRNAALLELWRERVGLLDALMDVHLTRGSNVGL
jgi:hypothetical protein